MKRGFTLIELLVVIAVISILTGLTLMSYTTYQNRADDSQAKSLLSAIRAGAERYYNLNNEYPLASDVYGGSIPSGTCASPANYTTAATILGVPAQTLGGDLAKLAICSSSVDLSSADTMKVYYMTKPSATDATAYTMTITSPGYGTCTFTLPATDIGNSSYIVTYYQRANSNWRVFRSNHGSVQTSSSSCPFLSDV